MQFGKKHAQTRVFQRLSKEHESEGRVLCEVFEILTSEFFFQNARETILLPMNNIHDKIMQN